jgi:hypothetical protein
MVTRSKQDHEAIRTLETDTMPYHNKKMVTRSKQDHEAIRTLETDTVHVTAGDVECHSSTPS